MAKEIIFTGLMKDFRKFYTQKYCESIGIPADKWNYVSVSCMDDIKVKRQKDDMTYGLWAGTSGCNFMMVDKTGGCSDSLTNDPDIYDFYSK